MKGSGDLARLVVQCATARGVRAPTNTLPVIQTTWVRQSQGTLDIILVDGDHFAEVQSLLERAYGAPDTTLRSSAPDCNGRSLTYSPQQIGALLNLTAPSDDALSEREALTVVSISGMNTP
jgi:hypothetical protein